VLGSHQSPKVTVTFQRKNEEQQSMVNIVEYFEVGEKEPSEAN